MLSMRTVFIIILFIMQYNVSSVSPAKVICEVLSEVGGKK